MSLKIVLLKFLPHLPGANELIRCCFPGDDSWRQCVTLSLGQVDSALPAASVSKPQFCPHHAQCKVAPLTLTVVSDPQGWGIQSGIPNWLHGWHQLKPSGGAAVRNPFKKTDWIYGMKLRIQIGVTISIRPRVSHFFASLPFSKPFPFMSSLVYIWNRQLIHGTNNGGRNTTL